MLSSAQLWMTPKAEGREHFVTSSELLCFYQDLNRTCLPKQNLVYKLLHKLQSLLTTTQTE